jgi:hypothetical protein
MLLLMTLAALGGLVLNEVLYDPPGPDSAREFVEIFNATNDAIAWESLTLEVGDGAHPGSWKVVWSTTAGALPAGGILLVGGAEVGAASERLSGTLQNGPDAIRLLLDQDVVDTVGYGNLTDASMYEGSPAKDVASQSLSRLPDGEDSQNNAADLQATLPTPGRRNVALLDWRITIQDPQWHRMWPGRRIVVGATLENVGWGPIAESDWQLRAELQPVQSSQLVQSVQVDITPRDLRRGESLPFQVSWTGEPGQFRLVIAVLGEDEWSADNQAALLGRVGAGPVVINEILYAPDSGMQEWIELWNRSAAAIDLSGWTMVDASGRQATFSAEEFLQADAYGLARNDTAIPLPGQSAEALAVSARPWPSLNNTDNELGIAETLVLRDAAGRVQDAVFYSASNLVRGRSLERVHADADVRGILWSLSKAPQGATPGRRNSATGTEGAALGSLEVHPNPFSPDGDGVDDLLQIQLEVPEGQSGFRVQIFDLQGRRRRDLAGDLLGGGLRRLLWDGLDDAGRHVELGVYVLHFESFLSDGGSQRTLRTIGVVRP